MRIQLKLLNYGPAIAMVAILLMLNATATGQWQRTFGGHGTDEGRDILATPDGGCMVLGSTGSFGSGAGDIYLLRLDEQGDRLWSRTYGGQQTEQGTAIARCPDGGYAIVGIRSGAFGYNGLLIRIDEAGDLLWEQEYGGADWDFLHGVKALATGFVLVGQTYSYGDGSGDAWLIRTDLEGEVEWTLVHGTEDTDEARDIDIAPSGGFVAAGTFRLGGSAADAVLFSVSDDGDLGWTTFLGGTAQEQGHGLTATQDGGFVLSGWTESYLSDRTMYMTKVNDNGEPLWYRYTEGGEGAWEGRRIAELPDGGLVIAGYTEAFGNGGRDMYMWHTDQDGYYIQGPTFGGIEDEEGVSIAATADGGFLIVGHARSFGPGSQAVFVVKNFGSPDIPPVQVMDDPLYIHNDELTTDPSFFHPNPAAIGGVIYFRTPHQYRTAEIIWFDASGKTVHRELQAKESMAEGLVVPNLSKGLYTIRVITDRMQSPIFRVMIDH